LMLQNHTDGLSVHSTWLAISKDSHQRKKLGS
jgi:hypothetical protein